MREWQRKKLEGIRDWAKFASEAVRNPKIDNRLLLEPLRAKARNIITSGKSCFLEEEEELRESLRKIMSIAIRLVQEPFRGIIESFYNERYKNRSEQRAWDNHVISRILPLAKRELNKRYFEAVCPLCGCAAQVAYSRGFKYPEGLSRHLQGWGQMNQCSVMQVAKRLARDTWICVRLRESPDLSESEAAQIRLHGTTNKEHQELIQSCKERFGF